MAKQFFFISMGVLALAIAYNLVAVRPVEAAWEPGETGCVACSAENYFWSQAGEAYYVIPETATWMDDAEKNLPVPASTVKFMTRTGSNFYLATVTDEVWIHYSSGVWQQIATFPGCGGTATEKSSWGEIKREFH